MSLGTVVSMLRSSVMHVVIVAGPALIIAMIIGLVIAIFQATTSIQDQSLTFVPKIFGIMAVIGFLGGWMIKTIQNFAESLYALIPQMTG